MTPSFYLFIFKVMGENLNNTNGFSSKDILYQLWAKVESIDAKLDRKMTEYEKRLIILEIESIDRETLSVLEHRVTNVEKHDEKHHATEYAIKETKDQILNKKNMVWAIAASIAVVVSTAASFYSMFN